MADYNSSNGMSTKVWGPQLWNFLHIISVNYPVNPTVADKLNYCQFLKSLFKILPCKYCRDNVQKNLKKANFCTEILKSRETFAKFMFHFHNCVNHSLNKPVNMNYPKHRQHYETLRAKSCSENKKGCHNALKCVVNIVRDKKK